MLETLKKNTASQSEEAPPKWLSKYNPCNPFSLNGFDCHDYVRSLLSTTLNQDVALSFGSLRNSDGQNLRGSRPENAIEIPCMLSYEHGGEISEGILFKSAVMEEKWDIYLYDGCVYFCRSWTGKIAFVAEISPVERSLQVSRIWAADSYEPALAIQQVDFLIKSHIYKRQVPHPLPSDLQRESDAVGMYSFAQYGRLCSFGSFESTLSAC